MISLNKWRIGAIVFASLAFLGGLWMLAEDTQKRILTSNAALTSTLWIKELSRTIPDLPAFVRTGQTSPEIDLALQRAQMIGGVYRFKIFDETGRLNFDTEPFDPDQLFGSKLLNYHNPKAAKAVQQGRPLQHMGRESVEGKTRFFVETFVPVEVERTVIGTLEVYVDVTESATLMRKELKRNAAVLILVAALGCWLPLGAYVWRTNQSQRMAQELESAGTIDPLTGLPNRRALLQTLAKQTGEDISGKARGLQLDVLDIDHFKPINDLHGAEAGDALLKSVAISLGQLCAAGAEVYRLSGDEFAILTTQPSRCDIAPGVIHQSVGHPLKIKGKDLRISLRCSSGSARWPEDAANARDLLANAETARVMAKLRGRNQHVVYCDELRTQLIDASELESTVREAFEADRFSIHLQPYFTKGRRKLVGFETLLRMTDASGEPVSPAEFIPILEQTGLINPVGTWALTESCRIAGNWPDDLRISINLSPRQFEDGTLHEVVSNALSETGLAPQRLELEITESLMVENDDHVLQQLDAIRHMGVSIAIDDFGTGYSSLGQLWRFPIDKLKIDRSFITELEKGASKAREIVKSVVGLSHSLDMTVTVEGVETLLQARMLDTLGVDYQQGYLHGRPMPLVEAETLIRRCDECRRQERQRQAKCKPTQGRLNGGPERSSVRRIRHAPDNRGAPTGLMR
jgi:diguanylate cyclase (GGDEF)-like protein